MSEYDPYDLWAAYGAGFVGIAICAVVAIGFALIEYWVNKR